MITDSTAAMLQHWQSCADHEQPLDIAAEMRNLALTVVCQALFSIDIRDRF